MSQLGLALRRLVSPPKFSDPQLTDRAGLLHVMMLASLVAIGIAVVFVRTDSIDVLGGIPLVLGFLVLQLIGLFLIRRGHVAVVGTAYCAATWCLIAVTQYLVGTNEVLLTASFVNITFIAGFSVGTRAGVLFGTGTALWMGASIYLKATGQLPAATFEQRPIDLAIQSCAPLSVTAVLVGYGLRRMKRALKLALDAEHRNEARARQGAILGGLGQRVLENRDVGALAEQVAEAVADGLGDVFVAVYRSRGDRQTLVRGSSGWQAPAHLELSEQDLDDSPGLVYTGRQLERLAKFSKRHRLRAASVARVFGKVSSGGALLAARSSKNHFEEHELIFLHACASLLGAALERNFAEDQLRQSHKMEAVGQLAGGVAHDFNNLLTGILTCNELALEELGEDHPTRPLLEDVSRAGEHAALLTRQLLAFSRKETLRLEVVDLGRVVLDLGRILQRLVGERVQLTLDCNSGDAYVYADRNALEQIVLNLCLNARDAVNSQGRITVGVARHTRDLDPDAPHTPTRERVILSVRDDGCGMDVETRRRIFEPFFTTKGPGKGTGLGLATVQGIVEELGGQTDVESELGQGSCFYVTLPSVTATQKSSVAPGAPPPRSRDREVCLLVEDHPLARRALEGTLRSAGYSVATATNGREALTVLEARDRVDVVISDIVMPEMTGIEMAAELRRRGSMLPIVLLTGYAGVSQSNSELAVLNVPILTKPVPAAQLLALVREEIDKRAAKESPDARSKETKLAAPRTISAR